MTFKQAKRKLKRLAKGRYHALSVELKECSSGSKETQCGLYIEGHDWIFLNTFKVAFSLLEDKLKKPIQKTDDIEIGDQKDARPATARSRQARRGRA